MIRVLLVLLLASPVVAAEFEAGIRHVVVMQTGDSGDLDVPLSRGFSATAEWFFAPRVSAQVVASFVSPEAILYPSTSPAAGVDLGTLGLDMYAVTARWHFAPERRLSAFAGGGPAFVVIGDLDDRFGTDVQAHFDDVFTFVVEGGLRYRLRPRLALELGASWMPVEAETQVARSNVALPETLGLDPVTVSGGASWRF